MLITLWARVTPSRLTLTALALEFPIDVSISVMGKKLLRESLALLFCSALLICRRHKCFCGRGSRSGCTRVRRLRKRMCKTSNRRGGPHPQGP